MDSLGIPVMSVRGISLICKLDKILPSQLPGINMWKAYEKQCVCACKINEHKTKHHTANLHDMSAVDRKVSRHLLSITGTD